MKIYIAARFSRQAEAREFARRLEATGHTVVSRWLDAPHAESPSILREQAITDLDDVYDSDCLVAMSDGDGRSSSGGRHVELGIALGLGLQVFVLGTRENVFHYLPAVKVVDHEDDLMCLLRIYDPTAITGTHTAVEGV